MTPMRILGRHLVLSICSPLKVVGLVFPVAVLLRVVPLRIHLQVALMVLRLLLGQGYHDSGDSVAGHGRVACLGQLDNVALNRSCFEFGVIISGRCVLVHFDKH